MKLLQRIDQKISFILSALIGSKTTNVSQKDLEDAEIESQILEEQLENEKELLENAITKFNEDIEDNEVNLSASKILFNILISKNCFDELTKEELEDCIEQHKYNAHDIKLFQTRKADILKEFETMNYEEATIEELSQELEDILNG